MGKTKRKDTRKGKDRVPIPRPGVLFTDRKKEQARKAARGRMNYDDS